MKVYLIVIVTCVIPFLATTQWGKQTRELEEVRKQAGAPPSYILPGETSEDARLRLARLPHDEAERIIRGSWQNTFGK